MGFDLERDIGSIRALLDSSRVDEVLMVDANQGWSAEEALGFATGLGDNNLGWLEEPIRADSDISDWIRLSEAMDIPLAAGENINGLRPVGQTLDAGYLDVLLPDIAKWGGFTGGMEFATLAKSAGVRCCAHYLGGGIGLADSGAFVAAIGENSLLEVDVNDNPLRDAFFLGRGIGQRRRIPPEQYSRPWY